LPDKSLGWDADEILAPRQTTNPNLPLSSPIQSENSGLVPTTMVPLIQVLGGHSQNPHLPSKVWFDPNLEAPSLACRGKQPILLIVEPK